MGRGELERLSKAELIELVLRLQRPEKTSRTSSKPPSTDRKEQREKSKPGGAKPGHEGHSRTLSERADRVVDHRPEQCPCCQAALASDLPAEPVSVHEGPAVSARPEYQMPMWTFVERTRVLSHRQTNSAGHFSSSAPSLPPAIRIRHAEQPFKLAARPLGQDSLGRLNQIGASRCKAEVRIP